MATITLGSAAAPVILDPAQTIVEVHWPDRFTHIAFAIEMRARTVRVTDSEFCTPATVGPPIPPGYDFTYLSDNEYYYAETGASSNLWIRGKSGAWTAPPATVDVIGLPDLASAVFSHGSWVMVSEDHASTTEVLTPRPAGHLPNAKQFLGGVPAGHWRGHRDQRPRPGGVVPDRRHADIHDTV